MATMWGPQTIAANQRKKVQEPKLEVPTSSVGKAYVSTPKIWPYMAQYLHFRILEFPAKLASNSNIHDLWYF